MKQKFFLKLSGKKILFLSIFASFFLFAPKIFAVYDLAQMSKPDVLLSSQDANMTSMLNILSNADVLSKLSVPDQSQILISPERSSYQSFLDFGTALLATLGNHLISGGNIISDAYSKTDAVFLKLSSRIVLPKINVTNLADNFYNSYTSELANVLYASPYVIPKTPPVEQTINENSLLASAIGGTTSTISDVSNLGSQNPTLSENYSTSNIYAIEAIKEMNLSVEDITSNVTLVPGSDDDNLLTAFFENLKIKLVVWLADTSNGIGDLFAGTITARNELCIGTTCINQSQLQTLLQLAEQNSQSASAKLVKNTTSTTN